MNTITASSDVEVGGIDVPVVTDGSTTPSGGQNSDPAVKIYYGPGPSLSVYDLTGEVDDTSIVGMFMVDDESENPAVGGVITDLAIDPYQTKVNGKGKWKDISDLELSADTVFYVDDGDGIYEPGGDDELFTGSYTFDPGDTVKFWFESTFEDTSTEPPEIYDPNDFEILKATAVVNLAGRVDNKGGKVDFTYTAQIIGDDKKLTLDGEATDDGEVLTEDQLTPVVDAAIDYWAAQGVDAEGLETLLKTDVRVEDLGGGKLLGETDGLVVTLDDDAAGHGWSDSLDVVDAEELDLLSALTHEFGHVLGYDHDVMGDTLAVGERDLPLEELDALNDESPLGAGVEGDLLFG
jgi:hypothetical protein